MIRHCKRCNSSAEFYETPAHQYACKACIGLARRANSAAAVKRDPRAARKKNNVKVRKHYAAHAKELTSWSRQRHLNDPRRAMVQQAKRRAVWKGLPFDILFNDILVPEVCPVLGIPIRVQGGKVSDNSPSIDRINGDLGYVRGNVRVISFRANSLKSNATPEELELVLLDLRTTKRGALRCV